jgi:oxygen-independent coproporphyrinogen-3 oxidase
MTKIKLTDKIKNNKFQPEIYVYPPIRTYKPIYDVDLTKISFTNEINIYIHIPFCKHICSYCGYLKMTSTKRMQSKYVSALIKEIKMYKPILQNKNIQTIHFGGGTPSLLSITQIKKVLATIIKINHKAIINAKEISIEATPESIKTNKFKKLKKIGFNRVSIGIQSLNKPEIKLCKRNNSPEKSIAAIKNLKKIGFTNVVVDLMIGIEKQTVTSFKKTLSTLIKYRPDIVELYALGINPNTYIACKKTNLMTNKNIYDCYRIGQKLFLNSGYIQDCHNRYAIKNRGSFLQEDNLFNGQSIIGFGAGARTYANNLHYRNNYSPNSYLAIREYISDVNSKKLPIKTGNYLSKKEKIRQYCIYNIESLDFAKLSEIHKINFKQSFKELYSELLELKLAKEKNNKLELTKKGLIYRDLIGKELFSEKVRKIEEKYRPS